MKQARMELARFNMIEQQIRPAEVLDATVLQTISQVPRERFVPEKYRDLAFSDSQIPLSERSSMMSPIQEARLLQALNIQKQDKILEIGTGSGYLTALLATLGQQVISVEIDPSLSQHAATLLHDQNITNVSLEVGDASLGWPTHAPYDVIAVTGSMPVMCQELKAQLSIGGRLFVIIGGQPAMSARLITRINDNQWSEQTLFETAIAPLINAPQPSAFVF